jgi:hypothetical protein
VGDTRGSKSGVAKCTQEFEKSDVGKRIKMGWPNANLMRTVFGFGAGVGKFGIGLRLNGRFGAERDMRVVLVSTKMGYRGCDIVSDTCASSLIGTLDL